MIGRRRERKTAGARFEIEVDFEALRVVGGFERRREVGNQIVQCDLFFVFRLSHRVLERKVHDVFDRLRQVVRVGVHAFDDLLVASACHFAEFVAQDVEIAEERLHRGAKFVREIGERLHVQSLLPLDGLNSRGNRVRGWAGV